MTYLVVQTGVLYAKALCESGSMLRLLQNQTFHRAVTAVTVAAVSILVRFPRPVSTADSRGSRRLFYG